MREIWRGEHGGYPYWHDEGGNTVRIAPSSDGGINVWVTEQGYEDGPRLGTEDVRDMCAHLLALCDEQDARHTPAAVTPEPAGPRELSAWRIVAGKPGHRGNRFRENNGALEVLGGDGVNDWLPSRWRSLDELRADGYTLTEVPAVPPAEPGVGA